MSFNTFNPTHSNQAEFDSKSTSSVNSDSEEVETKVPSPVKVSEARMTERHRFVFNQRMFPDIFDDNNNMKPLNEHPIASAFSTEMSQAEWQEAIDIVRNFGPALMENALPEQPYWEDDDKENISAVENSQENEQENSLTPKYDSDRQMYKSIENSVLADIQAEMFDTEESLSRKDENTISIHDNVESSRNDEITIVPNKNRTNKQTMSVKKRKQISCTLKQL